MEGCETGCQDQVNLKPARSIWLSITELCVRADWIRSEECLHKINKKKKAGKESKGVNPLEEKGEAASKGGKVRCTHAILIEWRGDCGRKRLEDALHMPYTEKYCCKLENMPKFRYCHLHHCLPTSFLSFIFRIKSWTLMESRWSSR